MPKMMRDSGAKYRQTCQRHAQRIKDRTGQWTLCGCRFCECVIPLGKSRAQETRDWKREVRDEG